MSKDGLLDFRETRDTENPYSVLLASHKTRHHTPLISDLKIDRARLESKGFERNLILTQSCPKSIRNKILASEWKSTKKPLRNSLETLGSQSLETSSEFLIIHKLFKWRTHQIEFDVRALGVQREPSEVFIL